jgi:hypothetical protein
MNELIRSIPGADAFFAWFGRWPDFHDTEVVRISLDRTNKSLLEIHVFSTTSEVNAKGHFVTEKHAKLRLILTEITNCDLTGFNHQNVIDDLDLSQTDEGYQLTLFPIYGVGGSISAKSVTVEFEPGIPTGSVYLA